MVVTSRLRTTRVQRTAKRVRQRRLRIRKRSKLIVHSHGARVEQTPSFLRGIVQCLHSSTGTRALSHAHIIVAREVDAKVGIGETHLRRTSVHKAPTLQHTVTLSEFPGEGLADV